MDTTCTFNGDDLQALRKRAVAAWRSQITAETPQGWSISRVDFTPFLAVFPHLQLKPGFILRGYLFRERNDGTGVVWAMPEKAPFPEPKKLLPRGVTDRLPHPPKALDNVMEAIAGDGTPESYMDASLFAREIAAFGAFGHGQRWSTHFILTRSPWETHDPASVQPDGSPEEWQWTEPAPTSWVPTVEMADDSVTVSFYTLSKLGNQQITRFIDRYAKGQYTFTTEKQRVASNPQGFVW